MFGLLFSTFSPITFSIYPSHSSLVCFISPFSQFKWAFSRCFTSFLLPTGAGNTCGSGGGSACEADGGGGGRGGGKPPGGGGRGGGPPPNDRRAQESSIALQTECIVTAAKDGGASGAFHTADSCAAAVVGGVMYLLVSHFLVSFFRPDSRAIARFEQSSDSKSFLFNSCE